MNKYMKLYNCIITSFKATLFIFNCIHFTINLWV